MTFYLSQLSFRNFRSTFIFFSILAISMGVNSQTLNEEATDIMADLADVSGELVSELEARKDYANATANALELDVQQILNFVGSEVAYVPYRGVLRGTVGTLKSRYGNSFDQSIALASLLNQAGFEAQVLVGEDPTPEAEVSVNRKQVPLYNDEDIDALYEEIFELSVQLANALGKEMPSYKSPETTVDTSSIETAVLSTVGVDKAENQSRSAKVEADLFAVVRYRSSPSEDWQWFDSVRNKALPPGDATSRIVLNDSVPKEQSQFIKLELALETYSGEERVIASYQSAAANIASIPVEIRITPSEQGRFEPSTVVYDPRQNLIVSGTGFSSMAVSLEGSIVEAEAMDSGFGEVFQTGAGLLGDAIASLESDGKVSQAPLLEKMILRITTGGPGVKSFSTERILFDGGIARRELEKRPDYVSLSEEEKDKILRAQLLASVTGDYTVFTGVPSAGSWTVELKIAELILAFSDDVTDGELNSRAFGNVASEMITSIVWRDLGEFFYENEQVAHVGPSFAILATKGMLNDDYTSQSVSIRTDILRDGRAGLEGNYAAALRGAISAAAMESTLVKRLGNLEKDRFKGAEGAYERLETRISEGVEAIDAKQYLASLSEQPSTYTAALHREFIESEIAAGRQLTVWPGKTYAESVWLEHDTNFLHARLGTGLGEGNDLVEYMMVVDFILLKMLVNLTTCVDKKGDEKVKCIVCATGKTGIGVIAALGGPLIAVAAMGGIDFAAEVLCL